MQIVISIIINIVILAVTLPLFYIYIVSKARERLEKETMSKAREEIEALVKEFNNIALSRISILEDSIVRANRLVKELNNFQSDKKDNDINNTTITVKEDIKEDIKENINKKEEKKLDVSIQESNNTESNTVMNNENKNKKLDIRVEDNNIKINSKIETKEKNAEVKPKPKKNNIDTAAKAIDDEARREVIEKLRNKLDRTIKTNMAIYDKPIEDKTIAFVNEPLENTVKNSNKNEDIIKLYKEGLSKEEIAKKLNCSITEIDIVIDLNID
ncbi:hypothetical protein BFL38_02040 [Brachyspira hampsonii]|uniref:Uncharacterized protein n=1 Tax=Brachyspira hampsonii TaxID=1287055 RepID=A0A1E5NBS7_9SPIR|nr:hypothetical protein [Brachyspira hampsonii]OEJ13551.1 hypothetical protein BFL38_02040 [Brachyspira hampsonii]